MGFPGVDLLRGVGGGGCGFLGGGLVGGVLRGFEALLLRGLCCAFGVHG